MKFLPQQKQFINDNDSRYIAYIGGYGSGKTFAGCYKSIMLSLFNEELAGMIVSPTYTMSKDIVKRTLVEILEDLNINYIYKSQDNKIILDNSSEIWLRSSDNEERLKGPNLSWVGLDEAGQMTKQVWDVCISRVRDPKAKILQTFVTTTPEGFNWLYDVFGNEKESYKVIKAKTEDNIFLPVDYSVTLRDNYDEKLQKQYLDGDFVNITSGQVYYGFNRSKHLTKNYIPNYYSPLIVTCDFNINPCLWLLIQNVNNEIVVFDEMNVKDANTELMCNLLKEKIENNYNGIIFYGDYSSISQRSTASSLSDWQIIENNFKNYRGYQRKLKSNPKIKDSVNIVNNVLEKNKVKIDIRCKHLIKDLEQVVWSENKAEIDKKLNADLTHSSDALRYYIAYEFPLAKAYGKII